jgi:hypothetical protein
LSPAVERRGGTRRPLVFKLVHRRGNGYDLPRAAETERASHYFEARLPEQFDAVIHLDATRPVEPLDPIPGVERAEAPETYPTGL